MATITMPRYSLGFFILVVLMATVTNISCAKKNDGHNEPGAARSERHETPQPPVLEQPKVRPNRDPRLTEIVDILWDSPLGRTFFSYMFDDDLKEHATSRDVVDRVLSGGGKAVTKMSALQLMLEELYDNDLMGDEQRRKLEILRGDVTQRQMDLATHPTEHIAYIAATAFFSLLPLGYPPTRHALMMALSRLPEWMKVSMVAEATRDIPPLWQGANSYELTWVIGTFFKYFGPFSFLYFFWFDWKESTRGHSIPYHIEKLKTDQEYKEFLDDIRDL